MVPAMLIIVPSGATPSTLFFEYTRTTCGQMNATPSNVAIVPETASNVTCQP
jgi:hypothetical protein